MNTTVELPTARVGAFTLYCTGPRLDGRFALHRGSPTADPYGFARPAGEHWQWESADESRRGTAHDLAACLAAAHDD